MCSIALSYKSAGQWLWQIAANRDEHLERDALPPGVLVARPRIVGGQDVVAGGTWFAIQPERRMFAGLTNRHGGSLSDWRGEGSRGQLIPHLLQADSAVAAKDRLVVLLQRQTVNNFMMLFGDSEQLFYADYNCGRLDVVSLQPGNYVLCNTSLTQAETPKMMHIRMLLETKLLKTPDAWVDRAQEMLQDTGLPLGFGAAADFTALDALNVQTDTYGTRSALIATCHLNEGMRYLATEGNPSDTPFRDVTKLLSE